MDDKKPILEMRGIAKRYGSVTALAGVDFTLRRGEVMALLGENGAGKSTLVKILAGLERPDSRHDRDRRAGRTLPVAAPVAPRRRRLRHPGTQHHFRPFGGREHLPRRQHVADLDGGPTGPARPPVSRSGRARRYRSRPCRPGIFPWRSGNSSRSRACSRRNARILILDEPTAALSDVEIEKVMTVVRSLAREGRSIIYVTHRLGEVFELADRVTIFRNGAELRSGRSQVARTSTS